MSFMRNPSLMSALSKALDAGPQIDARQVVVLGVGSELRGDDAAGVLVAARLARRGPSGVHVIVGGTAPENLTAEVRSLSPSHLLIVDSADMGESPGSVRVIVPAEIGGASFSTHSLPLSLLAEYVRRETGCRVTVVGMQPRSVEPGRGVSHEVERAIEETVDALGRCLAG